MTAAELCKVILIGCQQLEFKRHAQLMHGVIQPTPYSFKLFHAIGVIAKLQLVAAGCV